MSSCRDLRHLHDSKEIQDAFSKLVSGEEKFCPECGSKLR